MKSNPRTNGMVEAIFDEAEDEDEDLVPMAPPTSELIHSPPTSNLMTSNPTI